MNVMPSASRTPRSIATRLTLAVGTVGLLVFLVVGSLLYWVLQHELQRTRGLDIEGKADVVRHFLDEVKDLKDWGELHHHLDDVLIGNGHLRIWLIAHTGEVLYGGKVSPRTSARSDGGLTIWREDGIALSGRAFNISARGPVPQTQALIAADTRDDDRLLHAYLGALLVVCALGVAAITSLGAWVARRELRPVRDLSREAAAISPDAMSLRLSSDRVSVELQALVDSFNRALDRVQRAYEHLESFNADVAHELRTPLTTMISGTEVVLARERPAEELRETLVANVEALRQLASMVNDMLFLAHADRGGTVQGLQAIDLTEVAAQVVDYFDAALQERDQCIEIHGAAHAHANPSLLRRALVNLVSNASRFTAKGVPITIDLCQLEDEVRVSVSNQGAELDATLMPRWFDRFFRADSARQRSDEHHGLGLAIVRAVALMHGGRTFATSSGGCTEVGFTIKSAGPQPGNLR